MAVSVTDGELTITAKGEMSLALLYLREAIADSQCWRAIVETPRGIWSDIETLADAGTANRANALAAVFLDRIDEEGEGEKPGEERAKCYVRPLEQVSNLVGVDMWDVKGTFLFYLELPIPDAYQESSTLACIDFWNKADRIIRELRQQTNTNQRLSFDRPMLEIYGACNPDDVNGRRLNTASFTIEYEGVLS